ncbi:hypothetical protein ACFPVX_02510 [Cohnella faecalis]|uniref:Uncharacterized protein n=1 Tax=Cohnella faecalis TaxID=2315694 RepID=A0A398CUC8_9BACL|nr:hypothetical protein [Cohnella faecalis]RIE04869.1 hypothetical protein D3H35_05240 [Cohnella faecalis]
MKSDHEFYSTRKGIEKDKLNLMDLTEVFQIILHELTQERYFATFYGDNDNFDNWTPGIAGRNFEAYCLSVIGRRIKDPFYQDSLKYSETDLFDLIELLHRNIELKWSIAFSKFEFESIEQAKEHSQSVFRDKINKQLSRYGIGWELTRESFIREIIATELSELIDNIAAYGDEENVDNRIRRAIKEFFRYGATDLSKKGALIEIGGALEIIRKEIESALPIEEAAIFTILNNFDLRHNRKLKTSGYDTSIYYPWMLYTFLATFEAFVKIRQRSN